MSHWANCQRCPAKLVIMAKSRFNTDLICGSCENKERAHPKYLGAWEAELAEVYKGNMNFQGIGKPDDL